MKKSVALLVSSLSVFALCSDAAAAPHNPKAATIKENARLGKTQAVKHEREGKAVEDLAKAASEKPEARKLNVEEIYSAIKGDYDAMVEMGDDSVNERFGAAVALFKKCLNGVDGEVLAPYAVTLLKSLESAEMEGKHKKGLKKILRNVAQVLEDGVLTEGDDKAATGKTGTRTEGEGGETSDAE